MMKKNVNLSAPWIGYYREVNELFGSDPNVDIEYDDAAKTMKVYVNGSEKADAISHLLPTEKVFGNVVLKITVIPANVIKQMKKIDYIEKAFEGNPRFAGVIRIPIEVTQTNPIDYAMFQPEVVQYFNDNLHDPHGNVNSLLEIIARDVIGESEGVYFSTEKKDVTAVG